ncbi:6-carboxytetrahydropterin synthase [Candidatus Kapabacteria bacterium]|nr:6-carboxytetrahydropterin synthase [Candidatus Kapabacteria bacterium]
MVKLGKEFIWQMAHRLPYHDAGCQNIHGHSYKMILTLEGELNDKGMLLDFYDIATIVEPFLMGKLDHAMVCNSSDKKMIDFLKENGMKYFVFDEYTTCENLCGLFMRELKPKFAEHKNIKVIGIRIFETADAYAEVVESI